MISWCDIYNPVGQVNMDFRWFNYLSGHTYILI